MTDAPIGSPPTGGAVDRYGREVIDPTKNVLDLVNAAVKRSDDLRTAENSRLREALDRNAAHLHQIVAMTADNIEKTSQLRDQHQKELLKAESSRIDANRATDIQAVQTANAKAMDQAQVLANQLAAAAESQRALVSATASSLSAQVTSLTSPLADRLVVLEQAIYRGAGKEQVQDPIMLQIREEVRNLHDYQSQSAGKGSGQTFLWGIAIQLLTAVGIVTAIYAALGKTH